MTTREVERLADKTIKVLQTRGWHQGNFTDGSGAVCLSAALRVAAFGALLLNVVVPANDPYNVLRDRIHRTLLDRGFPPIGLATWNDEYARSPEDVYLLVKEAVHS